MGPRSRRRPSSSALDPRRTFMDLVDPRELPSDLVDNIPRFKFQGTSAKVNFALDANPTFPALAGTSDQYRGFINIGPLLDYLERAFDDAKYGWYCQKSLHRRVHPVECRPRHGATREGGDVQLHPVRPLSPEGE